MKIGAIFLVSVMALAAIGGGYAAWFDTITISGTVNTGNVDIVVDSYSHTYVYKVPDELFPGAYENETCIRHLTNLPAGFNPIYPSGWIPVAHAKADQAFDAAGPIDDAVVVEFNNLFPCIDFVADVVFHYVGSIPAKINFADFISVGGDDGYQDWLEDLWNLHQAYPEYGIWVEAYRCDENGNLPEEVDPEIVDLGTQLHYCDYVLLEIHIHLPQYWPDTMEPTNDLMLRSGSFMGQIEVVQWNEYPYTHPTP